MTPVVPPTSRRPLRARLERAARHPWKTIRRRLGWLLRVATRPIAPRLGVLYQYSPRPLQAPAAGEEPLPSPAPLISIVTPSYNQGDFLERTIRSVLGQDYPRLQYIIQDGGSSDGTCRVLERYRSQLAASESAPDGGQADAVNRGFRRATGEILAYLNSDDLLLPGTLRYVARYFDRHPDVDVLYGHRVVIDENEREVGRWVLPPHDDGVLAWCDFIPQETLFWRRRVWERVGGALDETFRFALDWDLLLRFREAGARFARVPRFLGAFRVHAAQKTNSWMQTVGRPEMERLRLRCHGRPVSEREVRLRVFPYLCRHVLHHFLYRMGLTAA